MIKCLYVMPDKLASPRASINQNLMFMMIIWIMSEATAIAIVLCHHIPDNLMKYYLNKRQTIVPSSNDHEIPSCLHTAWHSHLKIKKHYSNFQFRLRDFYRNHHHFIRFTIRLSISIYLVMQFFFLLFSYFSFVSMSLLFTRMVGHTCDVAKAYFNL